MKTKWLAGSLILLLAQNAFAEAQSNPVKEIVSNAYDVQTGKYIYSEYHREFYSSGQHIYSIVEYRTPDRLLARKVINFARSKEAPDFRLEDVRTGYLEGAEASASGYRLFARKSIRDPLMERILAIPEPAVIDGGFDYFIRNKFDRIAAGERMIIQFGSAFQQDFFRFDVYKTANGNFKGKPAIFINVEAHNFLLKKLVDPIRLVYSSQSRRLMSYTGVSNINDDNGKSYKARIEFVL
ncbi:MAG: hypothetical protein K8S54_14595 [Spirochaetia bacterium]|nr:hypothetical protein [Spirochaetia bacterium]